jgi:hypothetical protein
VVNPLIVIKSGGEKKACFNPDGLLLETTIVALEFYRTMTAGAFRRRAWIIVRSKKIV